jgi:conjugal transfer pilus assembly protein TraD
MPEVGGDPALHGVEPDERDIYMPLAERVGHMVVVGTTRSGKSRFLELLVAQDIRRSETVIVFDPKGDADVFRRVYAEAKRAGRMEQFYFFHLGYPQCSALQPDRRFRAHHRSRDADRQQYAQRGDAESFKQFVWKYVNGLVRAMARFANPLPRAASLCRELRAADSRYLMHWLDREPLPAGATRWLALRSTSSPGQSAQVTRRGVGETT